MELLTAVLLAGSVALIAVQYWVAGRTQFLRMKEALASLVNLLTTSVGVLLAIAITLHFQDVEDLEKVTARLAVALNEISHINGQIEYVRNGKEGMNTLPMPAMAHELLTSDLIARYVDSFTIYLLAQVNADLSRVSTEYTEAVLTAGPVSEKLRQYELLMRQYEDTLSIEFCHMTGRIGTEERAELIAGLQAHKISSLLGGGPLAEKGNDAHRRAVGAGCLFENRGGPRT